jgi:YkoY family integral membrane protein
MDVTALPSISDAFEGVDQWREVLAVLPVLVALELVLSADNAVALAAIARRCRQPDQERLALNIGIALALLLRLVLIVVAQWVLQHPPVQILAAAYLLWLFVDHLRARGDADVGDAPVESGLAGSLARTVVLLAFTDLAFSIDSVAAAVAISDQTLLIGTGAVIGIIALRFTSGLFIRWLEIYPRLETAGFLAVAFVAVRLLLHVALPAVQQPDWLMFLVVMVLFTWGFTLRNPVADASHAG